jgi:hypothetical protein
MTSHIFQYSDWVINELVLSYDVKSQVCWKFHMHETSAKSIPTDDYYDCNFIFSVANRVIFEC